MFTKLPFENPTSIKYETKPMAIAPYGDYLHEEDGKLHLPPLDAWAGTESLSRVPIMGGQVFSQLHSGKMPITPVVATYILRSTATLVTHVCREKYFSNECERLEFRKVTSELNLQTQEVCVGIKALMVCGMGSVPIELEYRWTKYDFQADSLRSPRSIRLTIDKDMTQYHLMLNPYQGMGSQHMPYENELSSYYIVFDGGAKMNIHLTTGSEQSIYGLFSAEHVSQICHQMFDYVLKSNETTWVYPWIDRVVLDARVSLQDEEIIFTMYAHMPNYHGEYGWIETSLAISKHATETFNKFGHSTLPMCFDWTPNKYNKAIGHAKAYGMGDEKLAEHFDIEAGGLTFPPEFTHNIKGMTKGKPLGQGLMGTAMESLGDAFKQAGEAAQDMGQAMIKKQPNTQADLEVGCSIEDAIARARKKAKEAKEAQAKKLEHKPSCTALGKFFKVKVKQHFNKTATLNPKAFGQMKSLIEKVGEKRIYRTLEIALDNWDEFLEYVKQERNWTPDCKVPNMGIMLHLGDELKEFYLMKSGDKDVDDGDVSFNTEDETKQSNENTIKNIWG